MLSTLNKLIQVIQQEKYKQAPVSNEPSRNCCTRKRYVSLAHYVNRQEAQCSHQKLPGQTPGIPVTLITNQRLGQDGNRKPIIVKKSEGVKHNLDSTDPSITCNALYPIILSVASNMRKSRRAIKLPISLNNSNVSGQQEHSGNPPLRAFEKVNNDSLNSTKRVDKSPISRHGTKRSRNLLDSARKKEPIKSRASNEKTPPESTGPSRLLYSHIREKIAQLSPDKAAEVTYPINPGKALKLFLDKLSDYEKGEILDYKNIYFVGQDANKTVYKKGEPNHGHDDERGDYKVVAHDHLAYRYEILEVLGKGSFGKAVKCYDHKRKEEVAVKIIRNKKRFHRQAVIEAKILKYIKEKDPKDSASMVRMHEFFIFRGHFVKSSPFHKKQCLTFELLSLNLYEFIKANNFKGLSMGLIRRIAIQVLRALSFLKTHRIIHCDLKPENILLKTQNKSGVKVIDFGSSCFEDERIYTYIQSRFYRAPEIMLGIPYTSSIDMWSLGCILAELWTGLPIFPGECESEQFCMIMEVCGLPPKVLVDSGSRRKVFFDSNGLPILIPNEKGRIRFPGTKRLQDKLRTNDENFVKFIEDCLEWNPSKRMTPEDALGHQWILEGLPPSVLVHHQRAYGSNKGEDEVKKQHQPVAIRKKASRIKINNDTINLSAGPKVPTKEVDSTYQEVLKMRNAVLMKKQAELPAHQNSANKSLIQRLSEKSEEAKLKKPPSKVRLSEMKEQNQVTTANNTPSKRGLNSTITQGIFPKEEQVKQVKPRRIMQPEEALHFKQRRLNISINNPPPVTAPLASPYQPQIKVPPAIGPLKPASAKQGLPIVHQPFFIRLGRKVQRQPGKALNVSNPESNNAKIIATHNRASRRVLPQDDPNPPLAMLPMIGFEEGAAFQQFKIK
eukprot:TRINITY_DN1668_c0_g1_i1.p1 TRINITY_DN1668_c0_g1~~TRINITY_DN1668_c0_g1_i1.p1  ORF type:complete len:896 (-),score=44.75 TRINITY_DN1668_c0_g1_i1:6443-9130(-)